MCPKVTPLHKSEVKERIIRAAVESFTQTGYDKTKMDDIAKRLGLSDTMNKKAWVAMIKAMISGSS